MAQKVINIGSGPNTGTGDPSREAFDKTNDNFEEMYAHAANTGNPHGVTAAQVGAYTKTEVDNNFASQLQVSNAVSAAVNALLAGAPAALDTLKELADAINDDANFGAAVTAALAGKQPLASNLTALGALTLAANKLPYATGAGALALTDLSAFVRTLLDDADVATFMATLGYSSSHGVNGYFKRYDGLICQWGKYTGGGVGSASVTFPIAFPTAVYNIGITVIDLTGNFMMTSLPTSSSVSGFTSNRKFFDGSTFNNAGNDFYWRAVGK